MTKDEPPVSLTVLAWIYLAIGTLGFFYHLNELRIGHEALQESVWIELTELLAILSGVFLLRGQNWARWLALAWIAFHVLLSVRQIPQFATHLIFCAVIAYVLFRPAAARFFISQRNEL